MSTGAVNEIGSISAEQVKLVLDVSRMLAVTTDLDALLQRIATAACELLNCERASIFLHDDKTKELCTKVALKSGEIRVPDTAGIVGATFTANQVLHVPSPYDDPRFNREVDRRNNFVTRNILAAPMVNIDRHPLGVMQAINKIPGPYDPSDLALIQMLADQAGVAIQRYRLQQTAIQAEMMRHEMDLARKVQENMLPRQMPKVPGLEMMGWTRPASVTGGDCFDLWTTPDGRLGIFLADASGHGLAPTLVVSQVRTLVRAFADVDPDPRRLLERANARAAQDLEDERFVTAFLAFISTDGTMHWSSAGHGPLLWRAGDGCELDELEPPELPLGVLPNLTGEPVPPVQLQPGGSIAIISDGIFEAMNAKEEQFGMDRIMQILNDHCAATPAQIISTLRDAATQWIGDDDPADDQTIVIVRKT
jgi:serine phosphatase RsbU (regulator of sigma subunit)